MRHIIHFVRNEKGMPVACLAFRDTFSNDNRCYVEYGYSVHNPADNWNRKLARQIAIGRMIESPIRIEGNPDWNINNLIERILDDLQGRNIPKRLLKQVNRNLLELVG